MHISPIDGWCLNYIVALDVQRSGTAGIFLRASDERRQVIAAYLSTQTMPDDTIKAAELADFIASANHRNLLCAAYGEPPAGLRGALARSGSRPHVKDFYRRLVRLLTPPQDHRIIAIIRQLDTIDPMRLRIVERLPAAFCSVGLVDLMQSPAMATDVSKLLGLLVENGIEPKALSQALSRVKCPDQLSNLWQRWALKSAFPTHPVPASDRYRPVSNGYDLQAVALRYRNCMKRYLAQALDGDSAFAEFTDEVGCVVHLHRHEELWTVEGVHAKDNGSVPPSLYTAALNYLAEHDVRPRPRHDEAIGQWNVLRRLTRSNMFGWIE